MEVHFYESKNVYPKDCEILHDWESVRNAIDSGVQYIHTTQMCELGMSLVISGYRMFVHQGNGIVYEIKEGKCTDPGTECIRVSQNAFNLWKSNVFRRIDWGNDE